MKKNKSDALIQRLVQNKITKEEWEELLQGLEDEETAIYLEASMKAHFDEIMTQYQEQNNSPNKTPSNMSNKKMK
ncbi:MAG: hypothetical protein WD398_13555 [Cyclobacteriaceae bacterium]